jgi:hypothetical protein
MDTNTSQNSSSKTLLLLIVPLIVLIIDVYIFRHIQDIKKENYQCKCGQTWQINKISDIIISVISIQLVNLIIQLYLTSQPKISIVISLMALLTLVSFGVQIYYIYLMFSYLNDLKKNDCKCVDKTLVNTLFYYSYFKVIMFIIGLIVGLIVLLSFFFMMKNIPVSDNKPIASKSSRSRK